MPPGHYLESSWSNINRWEKNLKFKIYNNYLLDKQQLQVAAVTCFPAKTAELIASSAAHAEAEKLWRRSVMEEKDSMAEMPWKCLEGSNNFFI